jgi:hypothetical protein
VRRYTGAGEGCTCCHRELQQLIDVHTSSPEAVCG